jgi:AcrR family transcriptional regulator
MQQSLSRRERKKKETRQSLLEAALALFRDQGYEATTIEQITERADVAKGTFFNYFPSKQALLGDLAMWRLEQLSEALTVEEGAPRSPVARIELLLRLWHQQMLADWRLFQQAMASRLSKPPGPHGAKRRLAGLAADLVREAQACGEIRPDVEPELVSDLLFVAYIRRFAVCIRDEGSAPPVEDTEQVIDLLMNGLAGPNWSGT